MQFFSLWFVAPRLSSGVGVGVVNLALLLLLLLLWFQEEVEFGYGTKAERWTGTILDIDDDKAEYGGLPPGTEVVMTVIVMMGEHRTDVAVWKNSLPPPRANRLEARTPFLFPKIPTQGRFFKSCCTCVEAFSARNVSNMKFATLVLLLLLLRWPVRLQMPQHTLVLCGTRVVGFGSVVVSCTFLASHRQEAAPNDQDTRPRKEKISGDIRKGPDSR